MATYEATKYNFTSDSLTGSLIVATGTIVPWTVSSAPTGYLECDGSAVSRTTYSVLFGVIGTTYGSGDGSSTFTLPDLKDRVIYGKSGTVSLAATGGSADATLVQHNHTATSSVTDPGHFHLGPQGTEFPQFGEDGSVTGPDGARTDGQGRTETKTTGITVATSIANAGSSATNANLQPYLCLKFMIKI
jgi:microcystin-dependent protein